MYISGPITAGSRNHNFHQACEAHQALMLAGFAPLNPMATMTLPFSWESHMKHWLWLECDLPWVEVADAVLRLPGDSDGADAELLHAAKYGVPIFYSVQELVAWRNVPATA